MKDRDTGWCESCEQLVWYVPGEDDEVLCPDCGEPIKLEVPDEYKG